MILNSSVHFENPGITQLHPQCLEYLHISTKILHADTASDELETIKRAKTEMQVERVFD